jgi:hypothetical protein
MELVLYFYTNVGDALFFLCITQISIAYAVLSVHFAVIPYVVSGKTVETFL